MQVSYFQRAHGVGFSIERLFDSIRGGLPTDVVPKVHRAPFFGTNPLKIFRNGLWARDRQGQLNHITGDTYYLALFLDSRRTVLTFLDCVALHRLTGWRWWILYLLWYRLPMRRAGAITTISEQAKRELLSYLPIPADRIHVVPACVGNEFQPCPKTWSERPLVLQIGTKPNKNLNNVAQALRGFECHLRILGRLSGTQRELLGQLGIDYSTAVDLADEQVRQEYERCDVVVFASTYEGFGMPILEAQAMGRPLITSRLPPMCEVAGEGACLVDPHDPASIRAGLQRIAEDSAYRESVIRQGLGNANLYRPEHVAARYVELYQRLLGGEPSRVDFTSDDAV